jgi:adenylate cyclase
MTALQKQRLRSIRRISLYFSIVLLAVNLFFSGFNLYSIVNGILLSFIVGFSVAIIEVFLFPGFLTRLGFTTAILVKSFLYLFILVILIVPLSYLLSKLYWLIHVFQKDDFPYKIAKHSIPTDWRKFIDQPAPFLRTIFIYLVGCVGIVFISQISRILGPGLLKKLITGKYHKPVEEVRIFMFLDLKSSTSIAEQLDNLTYSNFIRSIYFDIGEPVIQTRGEIYQYVGDEVVISWLVNPMVKHPGLCLQCFWKIEEVLNEKRDYYESKYGFAPQFKAGLHYGPVVATMVGYIKRELLYQGDVMNTAARIQQQCNVMNQKLLLSEQLKNLLLLPAGKKFVFLERVKLKGKQQEVGLYTVLDDAGNPS